MELSFKTSTVRYLQQTMHETVFQEETAETIVPDSFPDVGRVVDSFGTVLVRSKEVRTGGVAISGGINAGVLYVPEDGDGVRKLEVYIPFTTKVEAPDMTDQTQVMHTCQIKSMDCRMVNSRKLVLRANVASQIDGYAPAEQEVFGLGGDENLEVKCTTYPLVIPVECKEKAFTMTEEVELPSGRQAMAELYKYQPRLEVTESKLVGDKAVFKGNLEVKLLYVDQAGEMVPWTFQIPFSQYLELDQEYEEEELVVCLMLTGFELEPSASSDGRVLQLTANVLAQCMVMGKRNLEIVEDAYSVQETFLPQWVKYEPNSRIDHQVSHQTVRDTVSANASKIVDTTVYLDYPAQTRDGDVVQMTAPVNCSVLYVDQDGQLQQATVRTQAKWETELAPNCICRPTAQLEGDCYCAPTGDGLEVRCAVGFTADTYAQDGLRAICGGELVPREDQGQLPSVVICSVSPEQSFWSVAKSYHTTVEAILRANDLTEEARDEKQMLLIPMG